MAAVYDMIQLPNGDVRYRKDRKMFGKDKVPPVVMEALTLDNIVDENGLIIVDSKNEEAKKLDPDDAKKIKAKAKEGEKDDESETQATDDEEETSDDSGEDSDSESTDDTDDSSEAEPNQTDDDDEDKEPPAPARKAPVKKPRAPAAKRVKFVSRTPQSHPGMGFPRVLGKTVDIFDGETPHTHTKLVGGYAVPLSTVSFNEKSDKEIEDRLVQMGFEIRDFSGRTPAPDSDLLDEGDPDDDDEGDGLTDDHV